VVSDGPGVVEKNFVQHPDIAGLLEALINRYKAGSPTDSKVFWTHLKPKEFALLFNLEHNLYVSNRQVKIKLNQMGFRYRKLGKHLATGNFALRDAQFQVIFTLILALSVKSPIVSIDCKKKERLGNLYREGKCLCQDQIKVYDHDYEHLATGKIIPHGIYDLQRNEGFVTIGNSHETADFIAENLLWWWDTFGLHHYPDASVIMVLCDAGGANSYRHHAFKVQMLELAKTIGLDIIVCHYPPYASKWNPIEHRLFAQIHHAMQGVVLTDYNIVKELIEKTSTDTGLKVNVRILIKDFKVGSKTLKEQIDYSRIQFNPKIPELSYRICA
jgi:Rhodopirellula transposase DDE domain